jgi:putative hydrolase of the HAD superfamily
MTMIQAIIFDCFGVLASEGLLPFLNKYFGRDPQTLQRLTELNKQVDAGLVTAEAFSQTLAALAYISADQVRAQIEHNVPDEALLRYIKEELKPHYKIGMLSNSAHNRLGQIFKPEHIALFDVIVLSYQVGAAKPDPKPYQVIIERLALTPQECLLIDDQPRYVEGAEAVGMRALLYRSFEQMRRELNEVLEG